MDKRQARDDKKANRDPHEKLTTNIVSQEELSRVLCHLLSREEQWERTATKISSLSTTLIRHNNSVKITFSKLVYINRLPPNGITTPHDSERWESIEDPFAEMLGFIIPPQDQIKKNGSYGQKRTEVVGGFCHKRYERCFIGMIAMSLLVKFQNVEYTKHVSFLAQEDETDGQLQDTINKTQHEGILDSDDEDDEDDEDDDGNDDTEDVIVVDEQNLHWRHHQIFQKGYQSTYRAVRKAFQRAGVPFWEKVTHLRKAGTDYLTSNGFTIDEVKPLTKHKDSIASKHYTSQLPIPVCKALAGFLKGEPYNLPRANLTMPAG